MQIEQFGQVRTTFHKRYLDALAESAGISNWKSMRVQRCRHNGKQIVSFVFEYVHGLCRYSFLPQDMSQESCEAFFAKRRERFPGRFELVCKDIDENGKLAKQSE